MCGTRPTERRASTGERSAGSLSADIDPTAVARPGTLQRPEQRRLPGAVAPHERHDLARAQLHVDTAYGRHGAVADHDSAGPQHARPDLQRLRHRGRRHDAGEGEGQVGRAPACVAHRKGQGLPAGEPSELDDRRRDTRPFEHMAGLTGNGRAVAGEVHDAIGVLHDAFEPVLRDHDGDAEVVHEPGDRGEHLFGCGGIERRSRLVEHEDLRVRREHRADRDPLELPGRQLMQRAVPQLGEAEEVERLFHALAHHRRRDRELLHAVGELLLERVGDTSGEWILGDDAHDVGQLARRMRTRVATVDGDAPAQTATGEVGNQAVDRAEQRRLSATGRADHDAELTGRDHEVDVAQRRLLRLGIRDRDAIEPDHARAPAGCRAAGTGSGRVACGGVATGGGGVTTVGSSANRIAAAGSAGRVGHASG